MTSGQGHNYIFQGHNYIFKSAVWFIGMIYIVVGITFVFVYKWVFPRGDAGGLSREYLLRIPSVS